MQIKRKFRFDFNRQSPSFVIAGLVAGAALAVGGSVFATSIGSSISVSSNLTVTSNLTVGDGTAAAPSYSFVSDTDTGLFSPGANLLGFATGGAEAMRINASGNVGVGTTTPGSIFSVQGAVNFLGTANATSTIYSTLQLPSFFATSTVATSTFANGLLIGTTNGSVGIGTTTPTEKLSLAGSALIGAGANGTSTLVVNSSGTGVGSCIQMRAASSSDMYRIYIGKTIDGVGSTTGLTVERGSCR